MAYIIGSIHKTTLERSISKKPVEQTNESFAIAEAERLAKDFPEKKFIVYKEIAVVEAKNVSVTRL